MCAYDQLDFLKSIFGIDSSWPSVYCAAADPGGGGSQGGHGPPAPVKTSHKKMAAICGALYFMFLGPPL